jgi:hypothetical protein
VELVKSWLGQALRATGAAIVVPVAILAALSLTALGGGGLGDLGSLSQVVSGPQVAGSDVRVDDGGSEIDRAVTRLAAADEPVPGAAPGGPGASGGGGGAPPSGGGTDPNGGAPPGGSPPPTNNGGGGDDPPPAQPPPPEPPPPGGGGLVGGTGETVKDVTAGTPVAPTVEDAVDTLVETCARLNCP